MHESTAHFLLYLSSGRDNPVGRVASIFLRNTTLWGSQQPRPAGAAWFRLPFLAILPRVVLGVARGTAPAVRFAEVHDDICLIAKFLA